MSDDRIGSSFKLPKINGKMPKLSGEKNPGIKAEVKPGRNDPCPCESGRKYKKCCDVPKDERPPCSVNGCTEPVHWFLSPSVGGQRIADRYWVACRDHADDISAAATDEGMDVHVIPMDSLMGKTIGDVDPVGDGDEDQPEALARKLRATQDEILANTILDASHGENRGKLYRAVYGEPPYGAPEDPGFDKPRIWQPGMD